MKRPLIVLAAVLLGSATAAQPASDWSAARSIQVELASFKFAPKTLRLKAGQPVVLHLVNTAGGGHNFSAPAFFAAAQVRSQDAALVTKGAVEVPGHASRDVTLVPKLGEYALKCTHTMHTAFGMKGKIVVE